ncbi:MAG: hypothetical protein CGU29_10935 [Candidatus Dactylopiibacterium carminicum]|uniref:Uncharacterized protein n=1 Tax=Candidatus Dactylopiibacterium carminicum TaxID=857335 RepID=A0A272ER73_9RHOO|nr:hypothetical protein BGI27_11505 [Candidatus Dactylopiibacterium carminicum]PAS92595.1 MAG: hypothetical protein CGU29_10935 [Candidatus Dactylopiibacterium carminicum]PAS98778.1 MAG: hypothetical protein BSR46_11520 [Candidatus Dactylopiibacterium carminicum]
MLLGGLIAAALLAVFGDKTPDSADVVEPMRRTASPPAEEALAAVPAPVGAPQTVDGIHRLKSRLSPAASSDGENRLFAGAPRQ